MGAGLRLGNMGSGARLDILRAEETRALRSGASLRPGSNVAIVTRDVAADSFDDALDL